MHHDRFDHFLRGLSTLPSRRGVLTGVTAALLAALPQFEQTAAKKKKKKKRGNPPPTCAQLCPVQASYCAYRADAPTVCADDYSASCANPCSSDQDCLGVIIGGSRKPFCLTALIVRGNGQTLRVGDGICGTSSLPGVCADLVRPV